MELVASVTRSYTLPGFDREIRDALSGVKIVFRPDSLPFSYHFDQRKLMSYNHASQFEDLLGYQTANAR